MEAIMLEKFKSLIKRNGWHENGYLVERGLGEDAFQKPILETRSNNRMMELKNFFRDQWKML